MFGCPCVRIMIVLLSVAPGTLESTMTEDLSPAERYAAARRRAAEQATALASFREMYDFGLDPFQIEACQALEAGKGVLVAAPTGSGKTIVGEFAVHLALAAGQKCFYTTPIKALSNQKYADLCQRYGADKVGLLTGDNSVNSDAPVVVMTTEVLRNMLYAGSQTLLGLGYVVMDEVHYLSDRFRGAVWEEVIIHLPESVTLVSLSATVSNAEEFGDWLDTVRGDTEVIVSEHRPVPLLQHVLAGRRMYDLFEEGRPRQQAGAARGQPRPHRGWPGWRRSARTYPATADAVAPMREADRERERRQRSPGLDARRRPEVIERLDAEGLLPAITFIFSRAACEAAVQQCLYAGLRLNDDEARRAGARRSSRSARRPSPTRTCMSSATTSGWRAWSAVSPPTTRACCRPSRRSSRSCSSGAWSRPSSPPRPWRSASTCPPARWCWRSSSSGTASSTPTSRPASTPS